MRKHFFVLLFLAVLGVSARSNPFQFNPPFTDTLPVRGFAIAAPSPKGLDSFITFINQELAPRKVNTLILRVDYNYKFKSHPELVDDGALSLGEVKKIVKACKQSGIDIIPQINLLGHQSWASETGKLLSVYPQFDETPRVVVPEKYKWPNPDKLYCKSYCPLHPEVHNVVFALVDEICDAFEANAFHAGMDEVFYIADEKCPRCGGHDPAELYAGEVSLIRNHLADKGRKLWIWGDRLIDGKTTGIGEWEASMNNTHRAIDLIPKDVVINDWHYDRADQTAVYFAMKGFNVATCTYKNPESGMYQLEDMYKYRHHSTRQMKNRFRGVIQTIWMGNNAFLRQFYAPVTPGGEVKNETATFKSVFTAMNDNK